MDRSEIGAALHVLAIFAVAIWVAERGHFDGWSVYSSWVPAAIGLWLVIGASRKREFV